MLLVLFRPVGIGASRGQNEYFKNKHLKNWSWQIQFFLMKTGTGFHTWQQLENGSSAIKYFLVILDESCMLEYDLLTISHSLTSLFMSTARQDKTSFHVDPIPKSQRRQLCDILCLNEVLTAGSGYRSPSLTLWQGLDDVEEGEQEALDFILSQSADGRHGAAAHGGAASLQLQNKVQHTHKNT